MELQDWSFEERNATTTEQHLKHVPRPITRDWPHDPLRSVRDCGGCDTLRPEILRPAHQNEPGKRVVFVIAEPRGSVLSRLAESVLRFKADSIGRPHDERPLPGATPASRTTNMRSKAYIQTETTPVSAASRQRGLTQPPRHPHPAGAPAAAAPSAPATSAPRKPSGTARAAATPARRCPRNRPANPAATPASR